MMGVNFLSISAVCTVLSLVGVQYWTEISLGKHQSDVLIVNDLINSENAIHALELLFGSYTTLLLVASLTFNVIILVTLGLKTVFFSELYTSEIRKMLERLVNYIIYKGTFLPLVVPPTIFQAGVWSTWLAMLCFLKMFQALARDRLERLNASPSVTPWTYFRVYSALLLVFSVDLLWDSGYHLHLTGAIILVLLNTLGKLLVVGPYGLSISLFPFLILLCVTIYRAKTSSIFLLLFFEPSSIAFETLQAIVVHGFQLLDIWMHHSAGDAANCRLSKIFNMSSAGSLGEWKGLLIRNLGFFLDMMTLLMALAHYLYIWWLHGMAFHLVDAILFLNIRALLSAIVKRVKGFVKLRMALGTLHGALPDATSEELKKYDDECAICREPMAKAKRLSCNHLFHLSCLRSWLDQCSSESYSCPTCRKPLFTSRSESSVNQNAADLSRDEQLAHQISTALNGPDLPGHNLHPGVFSNQSQNLETSDWRRAGVNLSWLGLDGAGPSGFNRVQMLMRQLDVGETYAQSTLEDAAWNLFPPNPSQVGTSRSAIPPTGSTRYPGGAGGLHVRSTSNAASSNLDNIIAMAETVREVLPHVPDEVIFQDLQRTNSAMATVNNLLQM